MLHIKKDEHNFSGPSRPATLPEHITIVMPKATAEAWLTALTDGTYKQAHGALYRRSEGGGFCCLGVLQHKTCGMVEARNYAHDATHLVPIADLTDVDVVKAYPSTSWLTNNGIYFYFGDGIAATAPRVLIPKHPTAPLHIKRLTDDGWCGVEILNDRELTPFSFAEIAALIRNHIAVY